MHEFNSRLSFQNLKNQSKNRWLRCKRIQTYWQSSHRGWLVIDINFTQNKAGIFWHWHWFTSFCGWHGNGTWRCSNAVFKHKNCLNKIVQILYIYSLTSLCSQSNQAYHLHSVCILHSLLNTMNDLRVNLWQCLVERVISRYFCEHFISPLHMSS